MPFQLCLPTCLAALLPHAASPASLAPAVPATQCPLSMACRPYQPRQLCPPHHLLIQSNGTLTQRGSTKAPPCTSPQCGPRFELKLYQIKLGTMDQQVGVPTRPCALCMVHAQPCLPPWRALPAWCLPLSFARCVPLDLLSAAACCRRRTGLVLDLCLQAAFATEPSSGPQPLPLAAALSPPRAARGE